MKEKSKTFGREDIQGLLALVDVYLPVNNEDWDVLTKRFNKQRSKTFPSQEPRSRESLKSKFRRLVYRTKYSRYTQQLYKKIQHKAGYVNINGSETLTDSESEATTALSTLSSVAFEASFLSMEKAKHTELSTRRKETPSLTRQFSNCDNYTYH